MAAQFGPRTRWITLLSACAIPVLFTLHGCESDADQRLANAREMVRHRQLGQTAAGSAQPANGGGLQNQASGGTQAPPDHTAPGSDLPIYPGSRKIGAGPSNETGLEDGLTMEMLETGDSVDAVINYYAQHMISSDERLKPTRTEDRLDGRRVVRLSLAQTDGGLQTVEAREEPGKTSIQLLNLKGRTSKAIPDSIPGLSPDPHAPSQSRDGSAGSHTAIPGDLSTPNQPIDIPLQPRAPGR